MNLKNLSFLLMIGMSSAMADPSWTFKFPSQILDARYTIDLKQCPHFVLTKIPEKDSTDLWEGKVENGNSDQFKIVVLSFTDAWYSKPWYVGPDTMIESDNTFKFDTLTGNGNPISAFYISINLVPKSLETPIAKGTREIPKSILEHSVFSMIVPR